MRSTSLSLQSRPAMALFVAGISLFGLGTVGMALDAHLIGQTAGFGFGIDIGLELVGAFAGVGALAGNQFHRRTGSVAPSPERLEGPGTVFVTRGLLTALLESARQADPESITVELTTTPAEQLVGADEIPELSPVFTHCYLPNQPNSVSTVFGLDLQTPSGRIHGRFITHPMSELCLTKRDDLHEVVFVAVPPWDEESFAAFDRRNRRYTVEVLDAVPPDESLPSKNR